MALMEHVYDRHRLKPDLKDRFADGGRAKERPERYPEMPCIEYNQTGRLCCRCAYNGYRMLRQQGQRAGSGRTQTEEWTRIRIAVQWRTQSP